MKRILSSLLMLALALLVAVPAFAQEAPPEAPLLDIPTMRVEAETPSVVGLQAAFEALLQLVTNITFIPFTASFVVAATALLKRVTPGIHSGTLAFALQVATWVVITLALYFGVEQARIESVIELLTTVMGTVAGLVGSSWAAAKLYNAAKASDVPFLGASK